MFHGRPLRDGVSLQDTARFRDDSWSLAPVTLQQQERGLVLHFATVPEAYRLCAKRLCYALLSGDLPPGERRLTINSVLGVFYKVRTFLLWLNERQVPTLGIPPPVNELTGADLEGYQRYLLRSFAGHQYRLSHRSVVGYLWRYRHMLGEHGLPFDPKHIPAWSEPSSKRRIENTTDRIPEEVHGPLLVWSLRFIDDFAPDILAALESWYALRGDNAATSRVGLGRNAGLYTELRSYLDDHLANSSRCRAIKVSPISALFLCRSGPRNDQCGVIRTRWMSSLQ